MKNVRFTTTRRVRALAIGAAATAFILPSAFALETLLQEGFNTDGSKANPPRYTITGGGAFEPPFVDGNPDGIPSSQLGPVYWAHSFDVSFVGVPAATPARRAILAWDGALVADEISPNTGKLFDNTLKWLLNGKSGATVVFSPNQAVAQSLADRVAALGHTVVDDDTTVKDSDVVGDAVIRGPGLADPSRFAKVAKPVLTFASSDHDDLLVSSIGTPTSFEGSQGSITTATHPIAAGIPATFSVATGTHNWQLMGDILAEGSVTVASFVREIPPTAASLADVDALAKGTKQSIKTQATVSTLDFNSGSAGDWEGGNDYPLPAEAPAAPLGLVARGKLNVTAAGKYSFALGNDDGARLAIDVAKDGLTAADSVITDDAAHGHAVKYADVTFPTAGLYDFEVAHFNSGGGGDVELSVSTKANGGDTSAVKPTDGSASTWELIGGETDAKVKLSGSIAVTTFVPSGEAEKQTIPLLNVINGPSDSPAGSFFGGGPFVGFEGSGFFAGSAMNKWTTPDIGTLGGYRAVRLNPVNVTGKPKVKVTIALAATFLDFETSDFLRVIAYPDGENSDPITLADFSAPNGNVKYFADVAHNNANRLGLRFQDVSYDVPASAKNLIIEVRAATTFWNETLGFDNIRITSGDAEPPTPIQITAARDAAGLKAAWTGGTGPFLVQYKQALGDTWTDLATTADRSLIVPLVGGGGFLRVVGNTSKTVKLLKASLNAQQEGPSVISTATGVGMVSVDGLKLTYFMSYEGLGSGVTAAHIHTGARGASGSPFIFFTPAVGSKSGTLSGQFTLTDAQKASVESSGTYFNVHTTTYGGGEIRGQIEP